MADETALKAKVKKLEGDLQAAQNQKDKVAATEKQKVSKIRAELDQANEQLKQLGETNG